MRRMFNGWTPDCKSGAKAKGVRFSHGAPNNPLFNADLGGL